MQNLTLIPPPIPGKIYGKIIAVTKDLSAVDKNQYNREQKYSFRSIDDIYNTVHGLFGEHGVFCSPILKQIKTEVRAIKNKYGGESNQVRVEAIFDFIFYADDGSNIVCTIPAEGVDYGDKATNKSISAAMKYALITVFSIPTKDSVDSDTESPRIGEEQNTIEVRPEYRQIQKQKPDDTVNAGKLADIMASIDKAETIDALHYLFRMSSVAVREMGASAYDAMVDRAKKRKSELTNEVSP